MKSRVVSASILALAFVAAGCNSRLLRPPVTVHADAGGHPVSATIRDRDYRFESVLLSFFPSQVPLHAGDALNFEVRDTGEPHTVALGKLVDSALAAVEALGAAADLGKVEALTPMRRLPRVIPDVVREGTPRADRSAIERCFLASGSPPVSAAGNADACPEREQPEFDGTYSFYSSGYLEEGEPFRVKLAEEIRPGSYGFMCLVHRSAMVGSIDVRASELDRPRVADVRMQADDEENEVAATLEQAARGTGAVRPGTVLAGTGPGGRARGLLSSFIPNQLEIASGGKVRWQLYGTHSISFDPSRDAKEGVIIEDDSGPRINPDAWRPVGSPPPPAAALSYPPVGGRIEVDGGSWDGEGSFSSGVLRATPPTVVLYDLTFTKVGTYRYMCLVHPRMRAQIVVG